MGVPLDVQKGTLELSLLAVIVHTGPSISNGHYYTYARERDGQSWVKFDDSQVRQYVANLPDLCWSRMWGSGLTAYSYPPTILLYRSGPSSGARSWANKHTW